MEQEFGPSPLPLQELRFLEQGRNILVIPPGDTRPFNPVKRQWAFRFGQCPETPKLRSMAGPTPEALFDAALKCEMKPELLPQAVENYERVLDIAPHWIEAHINRGVALFQMGQIDEARDAFYAAVQLEPLNGILRYNLGCVLEEQGELEEAIRHLQRAARAMPAHADVHFNLALAYEKTKERQLARQHWTLYLRHAPNGPWAEQARARLKQFSSKRKKTLPIPFRLPN